MTGTGARRLPATSTQQFMTCRMTGGRRRHDSESDTPLRGGEARREEGAGGKTQTLKGYCVLAYSVGHRRNYKHTTDNSNFGTGSAICRLWWWMACRWLV